MEEIPQNLRTALKEAKELLELGNPDSSEKARKLLLDLPDAAEYAIYHLLLAKAAKDLNQMETAVAHLEKSLELKNDNLQAIIRVSEHKLKIGLIHDAVILLKGGIDVSHKHGDPKVACKIAALLLKANQVNDALSFLTDLSQRFPNDKEVNYTLSLAYRQQGDDNRYEQESLLALQKTTVEASLKQRIGLSKHFLKKHSYQEVFALINPLDHIDHSKVSLKNSKDIINCILALSHCETGSTEEAKLRIVEVKDQSNLLASFVWAKIQLSEDIIHSAYQSCIAFKLSLNQNLSKIQQIASRAQDIPLSNPREKIVQRSQMVLDNLPELVEKLISYPLLDSYDSVSDFLKNAESLALNSLPG